MGEGGCKGQNALCLNAHRRGAVSPQKRYNCAIMFFGLDRMLYICKDKTLYPNE